MAMVRLKSPARRDSRLRSTARKGLGRRDVCPKRRFRLPETELAPLGWEL